MLKCSTPCVSKGQTITKEVPLAIFHPIQSRREVLACLGCHASIDNVSEQINLLKNRGKQSTKRKYEQSCNSQSNIQGCTIPKRVIVQCSRLCGNIYCSIPCRDQAWKLGHRFLCPGGYPTDSAIHEFRRYSLLTSETFLFGAELIVQSLCSNENQVLSNDHFVEIKRPPTKPWWEMVGKDARSKAAAKQAVEEVWCLLELWLHTEHCFSHNQHQQYLTFENFSLLLGGLERCLLPLQIESSLVQFISNMIYLPIEVKIRIFNELDDCIPLELRLNGNESIVAIERATVALVQAANDPATKIFPSVSMVAIHSNFQNCTHSCLPNAQIEAGWDGEYVSSNLISLRFINEGESLTISFINTNQSLQKRQEELKAYFNLPSYECKCIRCCFEAGKFCIKDLLFRDLMHLANQAIEESRFDDAFQFYSAASKCTECDDPSYERGDAMHGIGVALLSSGKWDEAHQIWQKGFELFPEHSSLSAQAKKCLAYASAHNNINYSVENMDYDIVSLGEDVFMSQKPIFSLKECRWAIDIAEDYARSECGWTTSRHYSVPTTDLPLHFIPELLNWFVLKLENQLYPLLSMQFGISQKSGFRWHVHDAFLVKYHYTAQRYLPLHTDQSTHSLTIALNGGNEFEGGGTYFTHLKRVLQPDTGCVLSFRGDLEHGGDPILNGTRYIIAAFLYHDGPKDVNFKRNQNATLAVRPIDWKRESFSFGFCDNKA